MLGDCLKEFTKNQQQDDGVTVKYSLSCLQKIPVKNIFLFTKEVIVKYIRSLEKNKTISFKVMQMFFSFII